MEEDDGERDKRPGAVKVSLFDHSVENHFNAMAAISKLSGEADSEVVISQSSAEFKRFSSSITFLRSHFLFPLLYAFLSIKSCVV